MNAIEQYFPDMLFKLKPVLYSCMSTTIISSISQETRLASLHSYHSVCTFLKTLTACISSVKYKVEKLAEVSILGNVNLCSLNYMTLQRDSDLGAYSCHKSHLS